MQMGMKKMKGRKGETEKRRNGETENGRLKDLRRVFEQSEIFMNRYSGSRLICIQISHKGTVIPSLGHPGRKITQMTSVIANPGAPGRRNPVPLNKCR